MFIIKLGYAVIGLSNFDLSLSAKMIKQINYSKVMKKVLFTLLVAIVLGTTASYAQEAKKEHCEKAKKECCEGKKAEKAEKKEGCTKSDEKKDCCKKSKEATAETKSCGKKK
ncbi:hypothetical protein AGMMS50262_13940 [Bacteroidia bacterium]|nr:hypothetical protein AGMMS50262_13940 [Bacteroidia bacterium]